MYEEIPEGSIIPRDCFRCKGLAVVDYGHLRLLPHYLERAGYLLWAAKFTGPEQEEESVIIRNYLKVYEGIIDSMADNGREG